ncbi:MAG: autotransporter-associated beta strand repeat-containing protein [Verrucomicrobia bacterium]|nr:autotransporter-associated beta strand repeat-containing protein [Verrucomicrobiota bacterium]
MKLHASFATTAIYLSSLLAMPASILYWDGGTANIGTNGDGISAGGTGTWSTAIANWDVGATAHVAWDNTANANDTAYFGGAAGTVTLGTAISANSLLFMHTSSTYTLSGSNALTLSGTAPSIFALNTTNITSSFIGSNGLTKSGAGLVAIKTGAGNANLTGGLTVNQGILELDLNSMTAANPSNMVAAGNTLALNNGYLRVRAKTSATNSQTFGAVSLTGSTGINITHQSGTGTVSTVTLGTITRNAGSTLSFTTPTNGTSGDFYVPVATDLGNWAVISSPSSGLGNAAPIKYATVDGTGKVTALTGTAVTTATLGNDSAANYEISDPGGTAPATVSANSIRYSGAAGTSTLGTSFTANSLMNGGQGTGTGLWTIGATANAGLVNIGSNNELILHPGANGVTINSKISGAGAGLTINSYYNGTNAGAVTLNGTNGYTGKTYVNGSNSFTTNGHVVGNTFADAGSAFGAGGELILNGATLKTTPTAAQSTSRAMTWNGNSGFYSGSTSQSVTFAGNISGSGTFNIDQNPGTGGTLILSGNNDYSGEILFQTDGKLTVAGADALKNATLNVSGQRMELSFADNKAYKIAGLKGGSVGLNLGATGGVNVTIGSSNPSTTFTAPLMGSVGLIKTGAGTQTLVTAAYTGPTVVEQGTLKLQSMQGLASTSLSLANDGASGAYNGKKYISVTAADTTKYAVGQTLTVNGAADEIIHIDYTGKLYLKNSSLTGPQTVVINELKGSLASTTIEVKSGAYLDVSALNGGFTLGASQTLTGRGTVTGTVATGGTSSVIAPGASPGALAMGALDLTNGATLNFELGSSSDLLAIAGAVTGSGANGMLFNFSNAGGISGSAPYTLFTFNSSTGLDYGDLAIGTNTTGLTLDSSFGTNGWLINSNSLQVKFVPEPSAILLGGLGMLTLVRRRR